MRRVNSLMDLRVGLAIAEVRHDPPWARCTPDVQSAEVLRRLGDDETEAFADARAALVSDMEVRLLSTIDGDT